MGYIYECDSCDKRYDSFPPFAGEFTEQFLKTLGGKFAPAFKPGQKVTLCSDCMGLFVLAGKLYVCQRCGHATKPEALEGEKCPDCDNDAWAVRRIHTDD